MKDFWSKYHGHLEQAAPCQGRVAHLTDWSHSPDVNVQHYKLCCVCSDPYGVHVAADLSLEEMADGLHKVVLSLPNKNLSAFIGPTPPEHPGWDLWPFLHEVVIKRDLIFISDILNYSSILNSVSASLTPWEIGSKWIPKRQVQFKSQNIWSWNHKTGAELKWDI